MDRRTRSRPGVWVRELIMTQLWLIRHGQTEWSASGRHTSRTDVRLTEEGERDAESLRARLAERPFDMVLTSPLSRARETCRIVGYSECAILDERLAEWDYGAYEGRTTAEIRSERAAWNQWIDGVPGGETLAQVATRVGAVIERANAARGDVALFGHAHSLQVLAACWLELPPAFGRLFPLATSSLSVLGYHREQRVIWHWNEVCHLSRS